ncbi:DUF922 domain-containing protein [Luteibacter sp. 3190]|uniref:DUF922 domain-containing protein n=1 Tax=Luteibacter sp. 3190 TaxID=2817736 RepID=UPI0028671659|nr:DUF922 domain-containing protein [Luteibacter sp. 3190]MDR6935037.1 putative secreted Zn-dependent protease [Luteibacter sp. 3190]
MLFAVPPVVVPEPVVREHIAYYAITGSREEDLVKEMNRKGPTKPDGRYWAMTDAGVSWSYDVRLAGGTCALVKPSVLVTIDITLPSWKPPLGVDATIVAKWNRMLDALKKHENEHAQFSRDTADALTSLMREHASDTTCARLDATLRARGRAILDAEKKRNAELDARTAHGSSEGVGIAW